MKAQFNLAVMYLKGKGTTQEFKLAMRWYKAAARQGDAEAVYNMSVTEYEVCIFKK